MEKAYKKKELMLLEKAFEEEIKDLNYEFFSNAKDLSDIKVFFSHAIFPDIGEIPNFRWIRNGLKRKKGIFLNRVIYLIFFPFLFFLCRFKLFKYMLIKKKFKNVVC